MGDNWSLLSRGNTHVCRQSGVQSRVLETHCSHDANTRMSATRSKDYFVPQSPPPMPITVPPFFIFIFWNIKRCSVGTMYFRAAFCARCHARMLVRAVWKQVQGRSYLWCCDVRRLRHHVIRSRVMHDVCFVFTHQTQYMLICWQGEGQDARHIYPDCCSLLTFLKYLIN